jgi:hypothetical protein
LKDKGIENKYTGREEKEKGGEKGNGREKR